MLPHIRMCACKIGERGVQEARVLWGAMQLGGGPADPGIVAISLGPGIDQPPDVRGVLDDAQVDSPEITKLPGVIVATWGGLKADFTRPMLLCKAARTRSRDLRAEDLVAMFGSGARGFNEVLPPFASLRLGPRGEVNVATDPIGSRQIYYSTARDWAAISTSARILSLIRGGGLNRDALAIQAVLGWQLGQDTLFHGVSKAEPGAFLTLSGGRCHSAIPREEATDLMALPDAVR